MSSQLPVPEDDGAADHLVGHAAPTSTLPSTSGEDVDLSALPPGRTVLYLYPMTGQPGHEPPDGWAQIPGAQGCTSEACSFRDHHQDLRDVGVEEVFGVSTQSTDDQTEAAQRLRLPFPLLSDVDQRLGDELALPTFEADGKMLYRRLTLVIRDGRVEHAFYPVFPPDSHAEDVLDWLRKHQ